ncbi:MAG: hypothetical protein KDD60_06105 [Bdellovibrionales bacterium]|nr:hypothetical protein [Bdellovibrionales bacterium]
MSETTQHPIKKQVALLASEGFTQKQIALTLGVSQSTVSLLLQRATQIIDGQPPILDPRPRLLVSPQERVQIQNSLYGGELQSVLERYGERHKLDFVPKVYLGVTESDNDSWDMRVKAWGQALAPILFDLIKDCTLLTIGWGRHMRSLVDGLRLFHPEIRHSRKVTIFSSWPPRLSVNPESEDTIYRDHIALESNALAYECTVLLNTKDNLVKNHLHYLPGIDLIPFSTHPFEISASMSATDIKKRIREEEKLLQGTKSAFFTIDSFRDIFGHFKERTPGSLLWNVDAAILPSGPPGGPKSFSMGIDYGGVPDSWYRDQTLGDIGGVLIPSRPYSKMSPKEILQFERVKMRWLGLQEDDLRHIAKNSKIGTIVGAVGADRLPVLIYGIQNQLIRHLLCDYSVAKALSAALSTK